MLLFKTSGLTLESVVLNKRHAFVNRPVDWKPAELVLISKNKADCRPDEKQIKAIMRVASIRRLQVNEAERLWPGTEGRWRYLVIFDLSFSLGSSFDLSDVLGG